MGISALKPVLRYIGNSQGNCRKPVKKTPKMKTEFEKKCNKEFFKFNLIFNKETNLSQKCDFENIEMDPRCNA